MSATRDELVAHYRVEVEVELDAHVEADAVQFQFTADLEGTAQQLLATGFRRIGTSESFNNRNEMGLSALIREHGSEVGATMVIFSITPGKLTSAKRCADGRIDVKALRADPPASLSPRSYYLLQTSYFAPAAQSPA